MTTQLALADEARDWRLDERTRTAGRHGVAQARLALAAAAGRRHGDDAVDGATPAAA